MNALLPLPHFHSGKVRDTYEVPGQPDLLLMVASDRISTHNVKHLTQVPTKGQLLTALMLYWQLNALSDLKTHVAMFGKGIYRLLPRGLEYPPDLHLRAIIVYRKKPDPREFIWRRYLTGSLWEAYKKGEDPYGIALPHGLQKMHRFEPPIFTPTRKSENDEPVRTRYGRRQYPQGFDLTCDAFHRISEHLSRRGITLIDAKFEVAGDTLIDEWGTGDCCRLAWTADVKEGVDPPWLDKEYFRQAAMRAWAGGPKTPLEFDNGTIEEGVRKYHEAFEAITGQGLGEFQHLVLE